MYRQKKDFMPGVGGGEEVDIGFGAIAAALTQGVLEPLETCVARTFAARSNNKGEAREYTQMKLRIFSEI